ncbi:secretin and TonB N-terminal domain-containing protein [Sphingobacterium hotanense]|uniref:secretin and TonB N-terminal domain-containing protein n=1 Tax=Sphingobacterium hotanense TaxID=649196 RepID=UPI0021A64FB9|nr:secretin and TonB N-terminal domain-containing protein [Sphingobacterium hotanense]MCT1526456.1 general secretion pathway protein GspD [Sphingobacterium hotanense]
MRKLRILAVFLLLTVSVINLLFAQQNFEDRFRQVEQRLGSVAVMVPGMNEKVKLSVSGVSIQEFVRALAESTKLNITIDPDIQVTIVNNFQGETPLNILLFLSRTYQLDIQVVGTIMSISKMQGIEPIAVPKEIKISYDKSDGSLTYELENDKLTDVAQLISSLSGRNVVVPVNLQSRLVSGFIASAPFDIALEKLAFANNLRYSQTSDGIHVFEQLTPGEELFINQNKETAVRYRSTANENVQNMGAPGGFSVYGQQSEQVKLFTIQAENTPIVDLIKRAAQDAEVNYFIYSAIQGQVSANVKNISFDSFLTTIFQTTPYTFKKENDTYLIGDRKMEGLRDSRIVHLQHRSLDTVLAMIPVDWRRDVEIKEFKEQNMLLLTGSSPQISEIEAYIKRLDKLVPMVLIEVTILDIQKGKTIKTGISAGIADTLTRYGGKLLGQGVDFTFGSGGINRFLSQIGRNNSFNLGRVSPNFYVTLKALEENQNVEMRSVPKLSTLNGHNAMLSIGSKRYYKTTTQNIIPSLTSTTVTTDQFTPVEANMDIRIRPVVAGDDQVTLDIKVDITDFIGSTPDNIPPPTSTSKFESIVRAQNEDMIVLGGIERMENSDNGSGVPVLSRIPILRWLFSSKEKATRKVVSVVFIKPTIIY